MIHMMVGLPGSGKTTYARRLQFETGMPIASRDAIRTYVFGVEFQKDLEPYVDDIFWATLRSLAFWDKDFIVDCTNLTKAGRADIISLRRPVTAHVFNCRDIEQCWERKHAAGAEMPKEAFDRLLLSFDPVQESEGFFKVVSHNSRELTPAEIRALTGVVCGEDTHKSHLTFVA